jgi:hypothetical protein
LMAELPPRLKVPNKDAKLIIAFASWFLFCLYLKFINHLFFIFYQQAYFNRWQTLWLQFNFHIFSIWC